MDIKKKVFICVHCQESLMSSDEALLHECSPRKCLEATVSISFTKSWWRKLLDLDISWGLAFMGLVVMNMVLLRHVQLTFTESIIESLSLGFAIPRLLK